MGEYATQESEWKARALTAEAECGRLREREEQLSGWYNRAEQHISELKAEAGRLREQLDAARQAQREALLLLGQASGSESLHRAKAVLRAALGVEGPAAGDGQP